MRSRGLGRLWVVILLCAILLTACDPEPPTATPVPTVKGAIPPSPVVDPILPTAVGSTFNARLDFTPGANTTLTPGPTAVFIPITTTVSDLIFYGAFYRGGSAIPATIFLLHGQGDTHQSWGELPLQLQAAGYNVISFDWRGAGRTAGTADWSLAQSDLDALLAFVRTLPLDGKRITLIGLGTGATLAIADCAADTQCRGVVAISPRAAEGKLNAKAAIDSLGRRPLLIINSTEDDPGVVDSQTMINTAQGDKKLQRYPGKAHGSVLLAAQQSDITQVILSWLAAHG